MILRGSNAPHCKGPPGRRARSWSSIGRENNRCSHFGMLDLHLRRRCLLHTAGEHMTHFRRRNPSGKSWCRSWRSWDNIGQPCKQGSCLAPLRVGNCQAGTRSAQRTPEVHSSPPRSGFALVCPIQPSSSIPRHTVLSARVNYSTSSSTLQRSRRSLLENTTLLHSGTSQEDRKGEPYCQLGSSHRTDKVHHLAET